MLRSTIVGLLGIAASLALIRTSEGAIITYTSRGAWEAAVGPLTGTEDFNSFATDTQFRTASVALNNMTLTGETGNNGAVANKIDTPVFEDPKTYTPLDLDGTNFIFGDLASSQEMEFAMTADVTAWGVDTEGIANSASMNVQMLIYSDSDVLLDTYTFPASGDNNANGFIGVEATGGDLIGRIVFTNTTPFFDFFGLDNIGFVVPGQIPIPEPSSLVLLGIGAIGVLGFARKRSLNRSR